MDWKMINLINTFATEVRHALDIPIPIKNLHSVVEKIGGEIKELDSMPPFSNGELFKKGENFVIEITSKQCQKGKSALIALELGHLFMHMGYNPITKDWNTSVDLNILLNRKGYFRNDFRELEEQAYAFALEFLMPRDEFIRVMKEHYLWEIRCYDIEKVAKHFNVTPRLASNNGKRIGLLMRN